MKKYETIWVSTSLWITNIASRSRCMIEIIRSCRSSPGPKQPTVIMGTDFCLLFCPEDTVQMLAVVSNVLLLCLWAFAPFVSSGHHPSTLRQLRISTKSKWSHGLYDGCASPKPPNVHRLKIGGLQKSDHEENLRPQMRWFTIKCREILSW